MIDSAELWDVSKIVYYNYYRDLINNVILQLQEPVNIFFEFMKTQSTQEEEVEILIEDLLTKLNTCSPVKAVLQYGEAEKSMR